MIILYLSLSSRHLSDLCVDERAAVRKSASQTLFSTISAHGTLLQQETWKDVLWKVSFVDGEHSLCMLYMYNDTSVIWDWH